jgi:hypothetical protein
MLHCLHCQRSFDKLYSRGLCRPCYRSLSRSGSIDLYPTQDYHDHTSDVASWLLNHKPRSLVRALQAHGMSVAGMPVIRNTAEPEVTWCLHCEVNDSTTQGAGRGLCTKCYTQLSRSGEIEMYPTRAFWDNSVLYAEWLITNDITVLRDIITEYGYEIVSNEATGS